MRIKIRKTLLWQSQLAYNQMSTWYNCTCE